MADPTIVDELVATEATQRPDSLTSAVSRYTDALTALTSHPTTEQSSPSEIARITDVMKTLIHDVAGSPQLSVALEQHQQAVNEGRTETPAEIVVATRANPGDEGNPDATQHPTLIYKGGGTFTYAHRSQGEIRWGTARVVDATQKPADPGKLHYNDQHGRPGYVYTENGALGPTQTVVDGKMMVIDHKRSEGPGFAFDSMVSIRPYITANSIKATTAASLEGLAKSLAPAPPLP